MAFVGESAEDRIRDVKGNPNPNFFMQNLFYGASTLLFFVRGTSHLSAFCTRKIICAFRLAVPLFKSNRNRWSVISCSPGRK